MMVHSSLPITTSHKAPGPHGLGEQGELDPNCRWSKKVCTLNLSQYHQIKGTSKLNLGRGDQTGNSRQNESPGQQEMTHGSLVLWSQSATGASRPKPALCANQRMSSTALGAGRPILRKLTSSSGREERKLLEHTQRHQYRAFLSKRFIQKCLDLLQHHQDI